MTTCPYCLMTAARSHRQLQNRLRNIKKFSDVKVFECPKCGGTMDDYPSDGRAGAAAKTVAEELSSASILGGARRDQKEV
jgi:hypothetical protein